MKIIWFLFSRQTINLLVKIVDILQKQVHSILPNYLKLNLLQYLIILNRSRAKTALERSNKQNTKVYKGIGYMA